MHCNEIVGISKIANVCWQDNDTLTEFLGTIEARIELSDVRWWSIQKDDLSFIAIPIKICQYFDYIKAFAAFHENWHITAASAVPGRLSRCDADCV